MTLLKKINGLGYLQLGYSLLKSLGWQEAIILSRLITEKNYAISNNNYCNDFFIDLKEIEEALGFDVDTIIDGLCKLRDSGFISINNSFYQDRYLVHLLDEEIINYVKNAEYENNFEAWDACLNKTQRPKDSEWICSYENYSHAKDFIDYLSQEGYFLNRIQKAAITKLSLQYFEKFNENLTDNPDIFEKIKEFCNDPESNLDLLLVRIEIYMLQNNKD